MRPAEITDGFSHTLLAAEKRLNRSLMGSLDETGIPPRDDNEGYTAGWDEDTIRKTGAIPPPTDDDSSDPASSGNGSPQPDITTNSDSDPRNGRISFRFLASQIVPSNLCGRFGSRDYL